MPVAISPESQTAMRGYLEGEERTPVVVSMIEESAGILLLAIGDPYWGIGVEVALPLDEPPLTRVGNEYKMRAAVIGYLTGELPEEDGAPWILSARLLDELQGPHEYRFLPDRVVVPFYEDDSGTANIIADLRRQLEQPV